MTELRHPVNAILPYWAHYLPTGGENGTPAIQLDAQVQLDAGGALKRSCMFYRFPMTQTADIGTEVSMVINNNLTASANGYEGVTVQQRILSAQNRRPKIEWSNEVVVSGDKTKWFWEKSNAEWVRRTIIEQPVIGSVGSYLDIAVIVKATIGNVIVSNLEIRNKYERKYPVTITGQAENTSLGDDYEVKRVLYPSYVQQNLPPGATYEQIRHRKVWYIRTEALLIRRGERWLVDYDVIIEGKVTHVDGSATSNVVPTIGVLLKLRRSDGGTYDLFELVRDNSSYNFSAGLSSTGLKSLAGTSPERVAQHDYHQAEVIFFSTLGNTIAEITGGSMSHAGGFISIKTRGSEESG